MNGFGWTLPPGAATDPKAPWNQPEPPEDGIFTVEIAVGACRDCEVIIGPHHSEDVGFELHADHEGHDTEIIGEWEETNVLEEYYFDYHNE